MQYQADLPQDPPEKYLPGKTFYAAVEPPLIVTAVGSLLSHFLPDVDRAAIYSAVTICYGLFCGVRNWIKNRNKGKAAQ